MDKFVCSPDVQEGKILKYRRPNPVGEDVYLNPDGTITRDEDKIIRAQRIFLQNFYKPDGPGARLVLKKYASPTAQAPQF